MGALGLSSLVGVLACGSDTTSSTSTSSSSGSTSSTTSGAGGEGGSTGEGGAGGSAGVGGAGGAGPAVCGNGKVDMGEACDDGNTTEGDGCTKTCTKECTALHFDGTTIATAANSKTLDAKSVTLAAWYKVSSGGQAGTIAAKRGNSPGGHFTYNLTVGASGLAARLQTDSAAPDFIDLTDPAAVPDGMWHHAAVTYDMATGKGELFYDGMSVANSTKGTGLQAADASQAFTIGGTTLNGVPNNFIKGDVAYVVVYNTALTAAQVADLAKGKYAASPLALWLVPEGMGTDSADATGNNHGLTLPDNGWVADGPFCK